MTLDELKSEWEEKGYNAWMELWIKLGYKPNASLCPAKFMDDGVKKQAYLKGWVKASREAGY